MATLPARVRVVVSAEQWLVAEAVRAALATRDVDARVLAWPSESPSVPRSRSAERPSRRSDVGLLISDLEAWSQVRAVCFAISRVSTRWIVITGAPRGAVWGAVLDAGASMVLPSSAGLDEIVEVMRLVGSEGGGMPEEERAELRAAWHTAQEDRHRVAERLRSLSPREREVLRLLYVGEPVVRIAERFEVSPATVRSQVKSVLRKLDVNSQLGAVAALGYLLSTDVGEPAPSAPASAADGPDGE
ncbi:MAG TPA: LuxR C-terminal-related transcriptional regulator [Nocardioides sp.]|uniref:helix-turn-helix transcriptional regulator n=1 Tax=Nocardioides sp. TaxID=35761 RepID=UPI002ED7B822